jgi:hypothetical protein
MVEHDEGTLRYVHFLHLPLYLPEAKARVSKYNSEGIVRGVFQPDHDGTA